MNNSTIFDNITELPNADVKRRADALVGFNKRFERVHNNLKLLIDQEGLIEWSNKHHKVKLPVLETILDRYPLVLLAGDAGTGKTVSAEGIADRMVRELGKDGFFLKLSTRVRGEGLHGQMGNLVNNAFDRLKQEAGKKRIAFLFIDEADAIATTRSTHQMHQEEKAAVNTLIQKIDEIRSLNGRAIIFMSTNRLHFIDEAIIRRAAIIMEFERPDENERKELFTKTLDGTGIKDKEFDKLVELTGPDKNNGLGYSFSDLTLKILPEAVAESFPNKPLSFEVLENVIKRVKPSPQII
ncbi:ATP-binding protein [Ferruginibacter paludis]|uniref:ATP-binding protein n=1 Tax=Ferruginibacter paludis TaxID=1310417 RepID=UPI0025B387C3|nr:ATP-binding protein [Ferruginibacter paludis]MDN3654051.1 ATP-binding protein [Ferruginibacter paludis]